MLTIKLKIKNTSNDLFITDKQKQYSFALRKLYKNNTINPDYIKSEFKLNDIEFRSCIAEAKSKFNQTLTAKSKLESSIIDIQKNLQYYNSIPKSNKITRILFKLNNKLVLKNNQLSKDIVFGGKNILSKISYLSNNREVNSDTLLKYKQEYTENRILPLSILGEANQKGNRFIEFDLNNNSVIYKPNKNNKILINLHKYNNYKSILNNLQEYIDNKLISISVRLSTEYLYLIFDDEKLNGYSINEIERSKEVRLIKDKKLQKEEETKLIKEKYKEYYLDQNNRKLLGKNSNRYLSIDTNPDCIGCSIIDKNGDDIEVIYTFNYDLSNLNSKDKHKLNNSRRHIIYHLWKDLFKVFSYYNCGYLVVEDLDIKNKDLGNVVSNRKVNNLWYRGLSNNLIEKYCNRLGIIKIEVNPCYSSFIGNIMYNYIDSVNASIEIGRRGIFKYTKNKFYPEFRIGTIMNAMSNLNKVRDISLLKDSTNWVELYRKVRASVLRYRTTLEDSIYRYKVVYNIGYNNLCKYVFSYENDIILHINL